MRGLVLVAASGLAREVVAALPSEVDDVVLLDDDPDRWTTRLAGADVVGGLDRVEDYPDHQVVVCAGRGAVRRSLVERLAQHGVRDDRFATVVHPGVSIPSGCTVGCGTVLLAGVVLTADVTLGRHVVVMPHVTLTHDDVVEDYATLAAGVSLGGGVRIGEEAYVGMNASVREHVLVAPRTTVAMGAVLLESTTTDQTWMGVPARSVPTAR